MAALRLRTRKDGSAYTSVLFRVNGKQSSLSFDDHAKAVQFKDLVNQVGPVKPPPYNVGVCPNLP